MGITHRTKQLVAAAAVAGAVTAGTAGIAVAAEEGSAATDAPVAAQHHRRGFARAIGGVVSETLGVERAELRTALRSGQSIAEYASSLGQDPQVVVDALVDAANARIDQAVADGRITAERGDEIKANVPERVDTLVNRHFGQPQGS